MGQIAHVIKYLHVRCVVCPFERIFYEGTICRWNKSVILLNIHNSLFKCFYYHRDEFYNKYMNTENRNINIW